MKYGLIGEKLVHSFSKQIHEMLASNLYELQELKHDDLKEFLYKRQFSGINVTIPYKKDVLNYVDYVTPTASRIGAVNTIVNIDGKLYADNTDFYGMKSMIEHVGADINHKKVLILGTGGTSNTAFAVAKDLGAESIIKVSRTNKDDCCTYQDVLKQHLDADILINTTPCGMYPDTGKSAIDISNFKNLEWVFDVIYNPLRSQLVLDSMKKGINACGGLYMLVSQAVRASEIFTQSEYPPDMCYSIYKKILRSKENIVLIGMPGSGKSTIGKILADKCGREFIDTDNLIEHSENKSIKQIFAENGEGYFRNIENLIIKQVGKLNGKVISTGGGVILDYNNVDSLRENGYLYFLDRPLHQLIPTDSRPLSYDKNSIKNLYNQRYDLYVKASDKTVKGNGNAQYSVDFIERDFFDI